jgi:DUF2934 family protein
MTRKHYNESVEQEISSEMPPQDQVQAEIAQLAYQLYCEYGSEHGHDLEHWDDAERRVFERYQQLSWDLGMLCLHVPSGRPMFQHRIEDGEQLAHAGRQRHLFCFAGRTQALIESPDH